MISGTNRPQVPLADCTLCADPITFVRLDTGRSIPVNPVPDVARGNVACRIEGRRLVGFVISQHHAPSVHDVWRMVPHFATCTEYAREKLPRSLEPPPSLF